MSPGHPPPPLPPHPAQNRKFAALVVGVIVAASVLVTGSAIALRGFGASDITNLETSMSVGRQDFPDWPRATFDGPKKDTNRALKTADLSPESCAPLDGAPARQTVQAQLKRDAHHALVMRLSVPRPKVDYAALIRACTQYTLGGMLVIDVGRQLKLGGLPRWAVAVTEKISDRSGLVTPFASIKVLGRYRGVSIMAMCVMSFTDQPQTCESALVPLFNAQVSKLAAA
ncbi:hypothetical protein BOO86_13585 [Mycobacterium sp. CBMA 234]|uniref:hypothetical protein n=1 Tax=Mycolicibacterium sp. CBMA 234 TaxID=1918495 RepID=UPI0012DD80D7|nr:hypothetical protein [Mycolicibacterium sp. CBMA 234]MUL65505.1 hypothetical protein [Mycolicibacterium sp. CBMA 234]